MIIPIARGWLDRLAVLLGLLLLWFFVQQVDWAEGLMLVGRMGPGPFLLYLAVNVGISLLFANRWWLLLRGMGVRLPFGRVAVYRMIAATVSMLTPGPQFGGEPAQVYLLVRGSGVAAPQAIAAVALDRLLELAVNLAFLTGAILYTLWADVLGAALDIRVILLTLLPLALPPLLLFAFWWRGRYLTTAAQILLGRLPHRWQGGFPQRLVASLRMGEAHIHTILRENPHMVGVGALVSLGNWAVLLADFWLATRLIGMELDAAQFIGFVVAARIAILLPIPAGLGALEASQIFAAQRLGISPGLAVGLVLLFRVRDVALALWGLWLAWRERHERTGKPVLSEQEIDR